MRLLRRAVAGLLALLAGAGAVRADEPGPGSRAPGFRLVGTDGREYRLADFVGRRGLVLAWFPKAFTPG